LAAGSGLPVPRRRTFAPGILPFAHSMLPALRHPGSARPATPALGARAAPSGFAAQVANLCYEWAPSGFAAQVANLCYEWAPSGFAAQVANLCYEWVNLCYVWAG